MKNKFDVLIDQAALYQYSKPCSFSDWSFEPNCTGNFAVVHNGETIVTCESGQITNAKWGSRIADIEVHYILSSLIARIPNIQLDIMSVRTEDCLDVFGYDGPSIRIADIPGLEDIDYYRAWVTAKENATDPEKSDYVVYWDQGNTWCEVLAVFEGASHEEFVEALHNKYQEWIQEDQSYEEDRYKSSISQDLSSLGSIISAAEKSMNRSVLSSQIKAASERAINADDIERHHSLSGGSYEQDR